MVQESHTVNKHRLDDLMRVLHRPVELATPPGRLAVAYIRGQ